MCGYPCSSLISDCVRLQTFVWICRGFNVGAGWRAIAIDIYTTRYDVAACQPMPISQTPPAPNVGAGLPAIALGINTTLQAVAANANHVWVSGSFGTGEDLVGRSWIKQDNS